MGLLQFQKQPIQDIQDNNQQNNLQYQNEKQVTFEDRYLNFDNYIKFQSNTKNLRAYISNDEKYLVTSGRQYSKIQIHQLKKKKIIKIMQLDDQNTYIEIIKFSNNSRYLLFGDNHGCLYCYDFNNNLKLNYYQNVHSRSITDIFTIDDDQILTCSYDRSLIITNIKHNQQLLRIENAHISGINGIDFAKSTDLIISCSYDHAIKFFNRNDGKLLIEKKYPQRFAHGMQMIQLISNDTNLISSDYEQLILSHIDYKRLQLQKLKEFNIPIYNFTSVLNNNKIVVISKESVEILDKELVVLQSMKHNIYIQCCFTTRQLNSLSYIIVPGYDKILILKKVRKLQK